MRLTTKGRFAVTAMIDLGLRQSNGPVTLAAISQRLGQVQHRRIHRTANAELGAAGAAADAGDVDDRAAGFCELRPGRAAQPHRAEEFQREVVGPFVIGQR